MLRIRNLETGEIADVSNDEETKVRQFLSLEDFINSATINQATWNRLLDFLYPDEAEKAWEHNTESLNR